MTKANSDKIFEELESAREDPTLKIVDGCPVRAIREVKEDGTDVFIGDIEIRPWEKVLLPGGPQVEWKSKEGILDQSSDMIWTVGSVYLVLAYIRQA